MRLAERIERALKETPDEEIRSLEDAIAYLRQELFDASEADEIKLGKRLERLKKRLNYVVRGGHSYKAVGSDEYVPEPFRE